MGLRFRRRVKLLPGVRLNFSLSGVSATLGPRGASVSVGRRGAYANLGLGGGLSYRARLSGGGRRANPQDAAARAQANAAVEARREALEARLDAWRDAPDLIPVEVFEGWRAPFAPPGPEDARAFVDGIADEMARDEPAPAWARSALVPLGTAAVAGGGAWLGALAPEVTGATGLALAGGVAASQWRRRRAHARALRARAQVEAEAAWPERVAELEVAHRERAELASRLLAGDGEAMAAALEGALGDLDFPFETSARFELLTPDDEGEPCVVRLAVDLPEIEDLVPETKLKASRRGALREVRRSPRERYALWAETVAGVALAAARISLRVLPRVRAVEVAGYTQRKRRGSSRIRDDVVYVKTLTRADLEGLAMSTVDPVRVLAALPGPFSQSSTGRIESVRSPPPWVARVLDDEA